MQTFNQSLATLCFAEADHRWKWRWHVRRMPDELQEMINRGHTAWLDVERARSRPRTTTTQIVQVSAGMALQAPVRRGEAYASIYIHRQERCRRESRRANETPTARDAVASSFGANASRPAAIKEKGKEFALPTLGGGGKIKTKDIAVFFRQFSVMIDAGLPLVQCLEILAANQENQAFQKTLTGVRTTVEGGSTLANAMRAYPKIFDDLTTNMIDAGETGGILDTILQRLATYVEKAVKLKAAVKSALIYPVSVISIAFVIVGAVVVDRWCRFSPTCSSAWASELAAAYPHRHRTQQLHRAVLVVPDPGGGWLVFGIKRSAPTRAGAT